MPILLGSKLIKEAKYFFLELYENIEECVTFVMVTKVVAVDGEITKEVKYNTHTHTVKFRFSSSLNLFN